MRNNKPFNPAWDESIFDRVLRDWTRSQRPLSSLEIKLAIRAIVGPQVQVLQHEVSTLLRITFNTRKSDATIAKVGSYFALYDSRDERDASGKLTFIRYYMPQPVAGYNKLKIELHDRLGQLLRSIGVKK